ncbi:MAG: type III-B CRISPR module-associated protein Cmr5 [Elusimicrobiota bacterium]
MQTHQQERAKYALQQVTQAIQDEINQREFKSYASGFPAMIQMNGLGQAAAFYRSQGGTHGKLYDLLSGWLRAQGQPYANKDLLDGITSEDMRVYRIAQAEALLLLDWVKKFAKAYMRDE